MRTLRPIMLLVFIAVSSTALLTGCPRAVEKPPNDPVLDPWRNEGQRRTVPTVDPMLEKIKALSSRTRRGRTLSAEQPDLPGDPQGSSLTEGTPGPRPSDEALDGAIGPGTGGTKPLALLLGPGDELDLVVSGQPEFTGIVRVREDGTVALPTTSDLVEAAGRSTNDFAGAVAGAIHPRYMKNEPSVSVVLRNSPRLVYYIFGGVRSPGRYAMPPTGIRVLDAIMRASRPAATIANGKKVLDFEPLESARYDRVHVFPGSIGEPTIVDVTSAMLGGAASETRVQPGDVVVVPTASGEWGEPEIRKRLAQEPVGMIVSGKWRLP